MQISSSCAIVLGLQININFNDPGKRKIKCRMLEMSFVQNLIS